MTARARRLLAALEDGCSTRDEIFSHQGRFSLLNNAAAELRAVGVDVVCKLEDDGEYHYRLVDGALSGSARVAPTLPVGTSRDCKYERPAESTVEHEDGQLAFEVAA